MSTPPRIVLEMPRSPSLEDGPWSPTWPEPTYYYDGRPRALLDEEQAEPRSSLETIATPYNPGEPTKDPNLVTWNGPNDPENPKNWPMSKKWATTMLVSAFTFISPVSSSMVAPALEIMARDLGITSTVESQMTLSIFVLAFAIGPLFFGPLSESFGRWPVLLLTNFFYLVFNLGCGLSKTGAQMLVFRFLSGIGGSAPLAVGGGVLSDCWAPEQRGKAVGIYSLAPLLGPVIGPLAGGFIAENTTWRWVFYATTITAVVIQFAGFYHLPESHNTIILQKRRDRLAKETGNQNLYIAKDKQETLLRAITSSMARPTRLLATQPIVQLIALYMGYLFGLFYLILSTFPSLYRDVYGQGLGIGGLHYISLGVGFTLGAQVNAQITDRLYKKLTAKHYKNPQKEKETECNCKCQCHSVHGNMPPNKPTPTPPGMPNKGLPEFRIPSMFVGSLLIPIGLFWYGWSAEAALHWIMPDIGITIFAAGSITCLQCMQAYIIDSYTRFAASGMAAVIVLRSLAGFGFPLFAPYMYSALGYGWGNSVLGFVSIVVGIPAPYFFWFYGHKLRAVSKYAVG
ncbi:hypothetical protein N8I77_003119 [Diaporthe amygdali]|uniref:Major facilitator superfamily (MFS) profile domain-containing protein n=1 Tax=Phomopsis amygdali TaxID=1214568 RepID=A0AAD9W7C5_PHOAM|nr:hypothetical protein N8I77_003119 [Diaporthe amygdali]